MDKKTTEVLALYRTGLDYIKGKDFRDKDRLVTYYEKYYEIARVHKPIINEDWQKHGVTRHGWKGIKGTIGEMYTWYALATGEEGCSVLPVNDETLQNYGVDLFIGPPSQPHQTPVSVKCVKSVFMPHARVNVDKDFFVPGLFRVEWLSLVDPIKKHMWMLKYDALAREYCDITHNNLCVPKFEKYTYLYPSVFEQNHPGTVIYQDLSKI